MSLDLDTLNAAQREAVLCTEGPLLVLAGAGSGKTRVLTYRIAHIIQDKGVSPWEILAITFTNKAALEMRERLSGLIGSASRGMWVSTFHSMCVRILRANAEILQFTKSFTIYDTDDQKRLVKTIMSELDIDTKMFPVNMIINRISTAKNELIMPGEFAETATDPVGKRAAKVYVRYQERMRASNAMDFDDLLLYTYLLLKNHPDVLELYQDRFKYVMVDEYQDTNHAQYAITTLIAAKYKNIMVVGDDDQSIYSWRGADLRNILQFEDEYKNATVLKLEQNYRSTGNILNAANAVIANNKNRKAKHLFTQSGEGEKIDLYAATDERDEGRWIASQIEKLKEAGASYNAMAVFYRTNAQSRVIEDMLLRAGIPYRIVGGTKFFDRAEIRHVMAYLSLIVNPADDISFQRIVNVPKRGIGKTTLERIGQFATQMNMPEVEAAELLLLDDDVRQNTKKAIAEFISFIKSARTYEGELRKVIERIVDETHMIEAYEAEGTDEAKSRIENIKELMGVVDEFSSEHQEDDALYEAPSAESNSDEEPTRVLRGDSLEDFIEWVRLRTDLDSMSADGQAVTLMTIHSAKGLEFDNVLVAGMEESIFPHLNSIGEESLIEEERRLAYVAITRARKRLFMTYAQTRQLYGQTNANPVSRFIAEIPSELRRGAGLGSDGFSGTGWEKRGSRRGIAGAGTEAGGGKVFGQSSARSSRPTRSAKPASKKQDKQKFNKGDTVDHKTFGRGVVIRVDGDMIYVKFAKTHQTKRLLKDFAPIVKVG